MACSDRRLCRAIRVLLSPLDDQELWTDNGPTIHAVEMLERDKIPMSGGHRVLFLAAFDLYNRHGNCSLHRAFDALDLDNLQALCTLMVACRSGDDAVEHWITNPDARRIRWSGHHCGSAACNGYDGPDVRTPRKSDQPFCSCACEDCTKARDREDRRVGQ